MLRNREFADFRNFVKQLSARLSSQCLCSCLSMSLPEHVGVQRTRSKATLATHHSGQVDQQHRANLHDATVLLHYLSEIPLEKLQDPGCSVSLDSQCLHPLAVSCSQCRAALATTHRRQSSSVLGLPYKILNMNPKKELLWGLWVCTPCAEDGRIAQGCSPTFGREASLA